MPPPLKLADRDALVQEIATWFEHEHLTEPMRSISRSCFDLAEEMLEQLPDSLQLALGLQKLMEAKDCFVRASRRSQQQAEFHELADIRDFAARLQRAAPDLAAVLGPEGAADFLKPDPEEDSDGEA